MILGGKDGCGCEFYFVSLVGVPLVLYGCHLHRALSARLVLCAEHTRARWAFYFGCFGGGQREYFILCHLLKCFVLYEDFLLPEENTLKDIQLNWLLKASVIKLWIHHSGVFTNIIPVLCLLQLLFWCWMSFILPDLPAIMRKIIIFMLWFLGLQCLELLRSETGQLLVVLRAPP